MRHFAKLTLAITLVLLPGNASAQIGGRIRSAVSNAARPQQASQRAVQMVVVPITPQVVANYEKGFAARDQEMRRLAQEHTPLGQYYAARMRRDSAERRYAAYNAQTGPDYERAQQLMAAMQRGDTTAPMKLAQLGTEVSTMPDVPEVDWSAQQAANAHMDTVMMQGAGYDAGEWAYLIDKVPPVVGLLANTGTADTVVARVAQTVNITPDEVRAIGVRRVELARALGWSAQTDEDLARASKPATENPANDPSKNYNACMAEGIKPIQEEAERRKAELEAAQQAGDMTKLVDFANRVTAAQQAATVKCAPLLNQ